MGTLSEVIILGYSPLLDFHWLNLIMKRCKKTKKGRKELEQLKYFCTTIQEAG